MRKTEASDLLFTSYYLSPLACQLICNIDQGIYRHAVYLRMKEPEIQTGVEEVYDLMVMAV